MRVDGKVGNVMCAKTATIPKRGEMLTLPWLSYSMLVQRVVLGLIPIDQTYIHQLRAIKPGLKLKYIELILSTSNYFPVLCLVVTVLLVNDGFIMILLIIHIKRKLLVGTR